MNMKKRVIITAMALFILVTFSACKKNYTCSCTYTISGQTMTTDHEIKRARKLEATAECLDIEMTYWATTTSAYCTLK